MGILGVVALVAAILVVWFLGALAVGLIVGRVLAAGQRRTTHDYDRAA